VPTNITTSVDTVNNIVCGTTPSLSPFAIFAAAGPVSTATGLSASPNSSVVGQAMTFSAQVSPSLVGTPTGTVTFSDGGTAIGTSTLDASATASFSVSSLAVGSHSITAQYGGDANFNPSTSPVETVSVNPAGTSVQLTTSASGSVADGTPVTLTAKVNPAVTGTPTSPTGTITFSNGSTSLGTGPVTLSQGVAILIVSTLPPGTDNITAQYSGDPNFTGSTSGVETVSVNTPDFTVSVPVADETLTLAAGQTSPSIPITVTPADVYTGTVTFSCGSLPAYITCTFNPTSDSLTFAPGATTAQTLTLIVAVAKTTSMLQRSSPAILAMAMPLGLLGLLPLVGKKRKHLRLYLGIVALALTVGGAVAGCSSASLPPPGTQSFTVTASSGAISHQLHLSINLTN